MTTQKRTLIELPDIIAIEYECSHCQSRYSVPINRFDRDISKCPNCDEDWFVEKAPRREGEFSDEQLISLFVARLKDAQSRKFGATVRLQVCSGVEA